MSDEHGYRTALVLFAVAVIIATIVHLLQWLSGLTRGQPSEAVPGTMGLAKARPPLDRAPGQPLTSN
jgi:hypothetical protein